MIARNFPPTEQVVEIIREVNEGDDNICVQAKAGTGKTTLLEDIHDELGLGAQFLVTSFTTKIVGELGNRLPGATAKGFHSLAYGILKNRTRFLRWGKDSVNKYKYADLAGAMKLSRMFPDRKEEEANWLLDQVMHYIMASLTIPEPDEISEMADMFSVTLPGTPEQTAEAIQQLFVAGREQTFSNAHINFDEMIYWPVMEGYTMPGFAAVGVDETQDTNAMQAKLIEMIPKERLFMVGDVDQAIYLFAGARCNAMADSVEAFNMIERPLTWCFRCGTDIIKHAQQWVPTIESPPDWHQGSVNRTKRSELIGALRSGDAVICRTNAPLVSLCFDLIGRGIKANIRGRNVGEQLIQLIKQVAGSNYTSMDDFPDRLQAYRDKEFMRIANSGGKRVARLVSLLEDKVKCLMAIYDAIVPANSRQMENRIRSIFTDDELPGIQLMSGHMSKGLQFNVVHVIEPDLLPLQIPGMTDEQYKQELNLCYVVGTRAKQELNYVYND